MLPSSYLCPAARCFGRVQIENEVGVCNHCGAHYKRFITLNPVKPIEIRALVKASPLHSAALASAVRAQLLACTRYRP